MKKETKEKRNIRKSGLRVVLDTNVYVSAFTHTEGALFPVWEYAVRGTYTLLVSPHIVNELGRILRKRFGWQEATVRSHLKLLPKYGTAVSPKTIPDIIADDPDDNHILACAEEGRANLIVSGDRHLRRLKSYKGIGIVRPTDFLRMLAGYKR